MALQQRGSSVSENDGPPVGNQMGTVGGADGALFQPGGERAGASTPVPAGAPNSMTTDDTPLLTGGTILTDEIGPDLDSNALAAQAEDSGAEPQEYAANPFFAH